MASMDSETTANHESEEKKEAPEAAAGSPLRRGGSRFWREWVKPFLIILLIVSSFRSAFADWNDVPTGSMVPTILEGDRIFVSKMAYSLRLPFTLKHLLKLEGPKRGDIVVFFSPEEKRRLVKRVVGIPGDRLELRNNRLIVNGEMARYRPMESGELAVGPRSHSRFASETVGSKDHAIALSANRGSPQNFEAITLGADQYFAMGDNRDNSRDSRYFGTVDRKLIVGRAVAVAFSLDRTRGRFRPRWNRVFKKLK